MLHAVYVQRVVGAALPNGTNQLEGAVPWIGYRPVADIGGAGSFRVIGYGQLQRNPRPQIGQRCRLGRGGIGDVDKTRAQVNVDLLGAQGIPLRQLGFIKRRSQEQDAVLIERRLRLCRIVGQTGIAV